MLRASKVVLTVFISHIVLQPSKSLAFPRYRALSYSKLDSSKLMRRGRGGGGRGGGGGREGGGGRGEYYKNKYGGGGRGRGSDTADSAPRSANGGGSYADLQRVLQRIDGKSYGAYHDLDTPPTRGWVNPDAGFTLFVERAQSDPFAPPTRCRVVVDASRAGFPPDLYSNKVRSMASSDYLLRALHSWCKKLGADSSLQGKGWSGPKGGDLQVLEPGQNVLEQSAVRFDGNGNVVAQITINLPARGRNILGQAAEEILGSTLPKLVQQSLYYRSLQESKLKNHVDSIEDQCWLQDQLESRNLVAFLRNGAILPRKSGVDDTPMDINNAVAFQSPTRLEVSFSLPNTGIEISGCGIPKGITLICGGGFHGKSTLLQALQVGVYPKLPGDGREFCLSSKNAFKIRSEDGRNVQAVDISTFINNLPFGKDTTCFSTPDASGSTSQAANIVEAVEVGADMLLIDEDTCATNFMIRDDKMMQLVASDKEPITPFVRIVRSLYDDCGISTILVIGGVGDYFDVADNVLVLDSYKCADATERAKQIVANSNESQIRHSATESMPFRKAIARSAVADSFAPKGKVKVVSQSTVSYGETELDVSGLEQIVAKSQTVALSNTLQMLPNVVKANQSLRDMLETLDSRLDQEGLDFITPGQFNGGMSRPRQLEIAGAINRLRRQNSIVQTK